MSKNIKSVNGEIRIYFSYDPAVVSRVRAIPGARFHKNSEIYWSIPPGSLADAISALYDFSVDPALVAQLDEQKTIANKKSDIEIELKKSVDLTAQLPNGMRLKKHQIEGITRMLTFDSELRGYSRINADDMGLGKTLQGMVTAQAWHRLGKKIIVIAPVTLKANWVRTAEMLGCPIEFHSWAKLPEPPADEYVIVADEAHYAKSGKKSQRGNAFLTLATHAKCVATYALTGTPMKNGRPVELFPLLMAIGHPLSRGKTAYEKRYCDAGPTRFTKWDTSGASNLRELKQKTASAIIRRTKGECLDLPEKTRTMKPVDLSSDARRTYNEKFAELRRRYHERIRTGEISSEGEHLVLMTQLRQAGSMAKTDAAIEFASEILEQGHSVVLFTDFVEPAKIIAEKLADFGVELLTGDVVGNEKADGELIDRRQAMIDRFQAGQSRVFVSTIRAGGVGITLTKSSYAILVDRPLTPGDAVQAEDRLHRIGQTNAVTSIWLQHGEIDERVDDLIQSKQERIDRVFAGDAQTIRDDSLNAEIKRIVNEILGGE
jgi:SNF2 family DNA or RNA helicase